MKILPAVVLASLGAVGLSLELLPRLSADPGAGPAPAAAPATAPATKPADADEVTTVHRGDIHLDIHGEGYFEAVGGTEVRLEPKAYTGEMKIAEIVADGAHVKKGDTLLRITPDEYKRQLAAATNESVLAHANLDKARSDVSLGEKSDALAMTMQKTQQAEADASVMWWEKVDGPLQVTISDFFNTQADDQLGDAQDELAELKKMYKSEELTNATTDIVMKRAQQEIALDKVVDTVYHEQSDEFNRFHCDFLHRQVTDQASAAGQLTHQLEAAQTQAKVVRETSLVGAEAIADAADRKVADLTADGKLLTIAAPADGIVLYGQLTAGAWQNADEQALRVGQPIPSRQVVMSFFVPGNVRATVDLPESQFFSIPPNAKVTVTPAAFPGTFLAGTSESSVPQGHQTPTGLQYPLHVSVPAGDARLIPGMRLALSMKSDLAKNVLTIPLSAVSAGQVWVRDSAGKTKLRDVELGATDGTDIEVRGGVAEGDTILTHAKK